MYPAAAENGKTTLNHMRKATSDKTSEISLSQPADMAWQRKHLICVRFIKAFSTFGCSPPNPIFVLHSNKRYKQQLKVIFLICRSIPTSTDLKNPSPTPALCKYRLSFKPSDEQRLSPVQIIERNNHFTNSFAFR